MIFWFFFFFQAEDGIRDHCVTGVQTCALPISTGATVVSSSVPGSVYLQSVTFSATVAPVAPGGGVPPGTVRFVDTLSGTVLGSSPLDATGTASLTTATLPTGSYAIRAYFLGTNTYQTSSSPSDLAFTINQDGTTTSVVSASVAG